MAVLLGIAAVAFRAGRQSAVGPEPGFVADWSVAAQMPSLHIEGAAAVLNGEFYCIGGFKDLDLHAAARVDVYDPSADSWRAAAPLPAALSHATAVVEGDKIWVAGGLAGDHPGPPTARVLVYDSTKDKWSDGPSLPEPRGGGGFVRIGRVLHYVSGYSERETISADHWALDLDGPGTWQSRAPVPMPRGHVSAAVLRGKLYLIGGMLGHDEQPIDRADVQVYAPEVDSWSNGPSLPTSRSHSEAGTFAYADRIFTIGGRSHGPYSRIGPIPRRMDQNLPNVAILDPDSGWSEEWSLPLGLRGACAGVVDGVLIVAGGSVFMGSHGQAGVFTLPVSALLTPNRPPAAAQESRTMALPSWRVVRR